MIWVKILLKLEVLLYMKQTNITTGIWTTKCISEDLITTTVLFIIFDRIINVEMTRNLKNQINGKSYIT